MTVQQLKHILKMNRVGFITKAAQNLYVAQSSVSNTVMFMEDELGFPVFDRKWTEVLR